LPAFQLAEGLEELVLRRARTTGRRTAIISTFFIATEGWAPPARVRFFAKDSASLELDQAKSLLRVDRVGRILGGVARSPADSGRPIRITRISCQQIDALIRR
jgi:hypothetical protein